jgi:ABC-2 type transport system permease protein
MIQVFVREFSGYLSSLIAYMVIGVFLTAIGLLTWVFPETSVLDYGYADMDTLFSMAPYVFIFLIPAITMKTFAEEKKMGTLELLLTKPLTETQIVLGKFFAAWALVLLALLPTIVYYFSVSALGNPKGNIDAAAVVGSYTGLILLAAIFCAIGVLASSFTHNQIVAFITAAFCCFLFYLGFDSLAAFAAAHALVVKQLGILYHYESLSRGLIDSRDVVYAISVTGFFIVSTIVVVKSRLW